MSGTFSNLSIIGRVGRDAELKYLPSGVAVAEFSLAVTKTWKTDSGEKKEKTTWFKAVAWRGLAEGVVGKYVKKGDLVHVEGEIDGEAYINKDGDAAFSLKVTINTLNLLGSKNGSAGNGNGNGSSDSYEDFKEPGSLEDIPF